MNGTAGRSFCNLDYLLGNLGGNKASAKRLVSIYLDNHPGFLATLKVELLEGDPEKIRQTVHDIRGSCVLFSADYCLDLTRRIDESMRHGTHSWSDDCLELMSALEAMALELRHAVANY